MSRSLTPLTFLCLLLLFAAGVQAKEPAHKILIAAYHMIQRNVGYTDLGDAFLDRSSQHRVTKGLECRLERMGYDVTLTQNAA